MSLNHQRVWSPRSSRSRHSFSSRSSNSRLVPPGSDIFERVLDDLRQGCSSQSSSSSSSLLSSPSSSYSSSSSSFSSSLLSAPPATAGCARSGRYSVTANAELQPNTGVCGENDARKGQGRKGQDVGHDLDPCFLLRPSSASLGESRGGHGDLSGFERHCCSDWDRPKKRCALCSRPGDSCEPREPGSSSRGTGAEFLEDSGRGVGSSDETSQDAAHLAADRKGHYVSVGGGGIGGGVCRVSAGYGETAHRRGDFRYNNDDYFNEEDEDNVDGDHDVSATATSSNNNSPCLQICDFVSALKLDSLSRSGKDSSCTNNNINNNHDTMGHGPSLLHHKSHSKAYLATDSTASSGSHQRGRPHNPASPSPGKRPSSSAATPTRSLYRDRAKDAAAAAAAGGGGGGGGGGVGCMSATSRRPGVDVLRFSLGQQQQQQQQRQYLHHASNGAANTGRPSSWTSGSVPAGASPAAAPGHVVSWSASSTGQGQSKFFTNSDELDGDRVHPPLSRLYPKTGSGSRRSPSSPTARGGRDWEDEAEDDEDEDRENGGRGEPSSQPGYTPSRPGDRTRGEAVKDAEDAECGGGGGGEGRNYSSSVTNNNHHNLSPAAERMTRVDHLLPSGRTNSSSSSPLSSSSSSLHQKVASAGQHVQHGPRKSPGSPNFSLSFPRLTQRSHSSLEVPHSTPPSSFRAHSATPSLDSLRRDYPSSPRRQHHDSSPTSAKHHIRLCTYSYDGSTPRKGKGSDNDVSASDDISMFREDFRPRCSSDVSMHMRRRRQLPRSPHSLYGKTAEEDEDDHARVHWADEARGSPLATSVLLSSIRPRAMSHGSAELPRKPILKKPVGF